MGQYTGKEAIEAILEYYDGDRDIVITKLNISLPTFYNWKAGRTVPPPEKLEELNNFILKMDEEDDDPLEGDAFMKDLRNNGRKFEFIQSSKIEDILASQLMKKYSGKKDVLINPSARASYGIVRPDIVVVDVETQRIEQIIEVKSSKASVEVLGRIMGYAKTFWEQSGKGKLEDITLTIVAPHFNDDLKTAVEYIQLVNPGLKVQLISIDDLFELKI